MRGTILLAGLLLAGCEQKQKMPTTPSAYDSAMTDAAIKDEKNRREIEARRRQVSDQAQSDLANITAQPAPKGEKIPGSVFIDNQPDTRGPSQSPDRPQ